MPLMTRSLALLALVLLLVGCTRFGANPSGGPFARKPRTKPEPYAPIPPGPPATSSPLALATPTPPEARPTSSAPTVVPAGGMEPVALDNAFRGPAPSVVVPAGGLADTAATAAQLLPRRRPDPLPGQLPSPFAKDGPKPMAAPPSTTAHIDEVKKLVAAAAAKWKQVDCYEALVTRRELAPNKHLTDDVVLYQFRKEPMAVYIKNLSESGKGREIIYSKNEDKIHAIIGKGDDGFLYKVGQKAPAVSPDFAMVKTKTRYSIREAGHGTPIARVGAWVAKAEAGKIPAENLTYLGEVNRKEFPYPLLGVQLKLRPNDDPLMPNGGMRQWFFDPKTDSPSYTFPVLIIATEPNGKEVEYYLFQKMNFNVKFTDADFDPARLGKK
jgi:hypothetical protein